MTFHSDKNYIWNWSKVIDIFHIFYFFHIFYENINQKHNLLAGYIFEPLLLMYVLKIVCQSYLPSVS